MRYLTNRTSFLITTTLLVMLAMAIGAPSAWATLTAKANHDDIKINYNYNGSTVSVSGIDDPGVDLIIKITSTGSTEEELMRKDKEAGLWMNVEKLHFEDAPAFYYIRSTKDLASLLSPADLGANGLGYDALEQNIGLKPDKTPEQKKALMDDYIKYKEDGNVYSRSVGSVDMKLNDSGQPSYYTIFDWPYQAPPGEYDVAVYSVKDHAITETAHAKVLVEQDGVVKSLSDLAQNNGALYGTAAIGVSLTAGFGVGLIFKGGGGSH